MAADPSAPGVRRGRPLVALAAAFCLTAGAASAASAPIALRVGQQPDAAGRTVVSVWMATTADADNLQVTVFIQPGRGGCQADPLRPWPRGSAQLLYGWTPYPARRWDRLVRFVAPGPGPWTVCGYVVSEAATRPGQGQYVQARTLARFVARAPSRGAPIAAARVDRLRRGPQAASPAPSGPGHRARGMPAGAHDRRCVDAGVVRRKSHRAGELGLRLVPARRIRPPNQPPAAAVLASPGTGPPAHTRLPRDAGELAGVLPTRRGMRHRALPLRGSRLPAMSAQR